MRHVVEARPLQRQCQTRFIIAGASLRYYWSLKWVLNWCWVNM